MPPFSFPARNRGPRPGQAAPPFDLPRATGGRVALEQLRGRAVVLFFLPKASTPG
jgi:peroxiredoxin Q/BCP